MKGTEAGGGKEERIKGTGSGVGEGKGERDKLVATMTQWMAKSHGLVWWSLVNTIFFFSK